MRNESVAILDIRSNEVAFLLGAKGVNGTFVFSGSKSEKYEGYSTEGFYDVESFRRAVIATVTSVSQNYAGKIEEIYVGVPSAFISVYTKGHTNSYTSKRKICAQDVDALYESGESELLVQGRCIRRSAMYFSLGDNRKYFSTNDLYGVPTTLLKGALCYYYISESFYGCICSLLNELGFSEPKFIPSALAQASYLLPEKKREGYAFLLDIGFLTSTVSVVYGNGIVHEETFDCGIGTTLVALMEGLSVDYAEAEEILTAANVSGGSIPADQFWMSEQRDGRYSVREINDIIKCSLDVLCEKVDAFFAKHYKDKSAIGLTVNPISLTGEGIAALKGAAEHISKRLNRLTEVVAPDLPYYDKPTFSSRIALLNMALADRQKRSWRFRFFNNFGGKRR